MDADAEFNPAILRQSDILLGHAALNFDGAAYGVYDTAELDKSAVPCILDDTSVMISDFGVEKSSSESFQPGQCAFFVDPY